MTGSRYPHLGGFESTQMFGSGEDVLGTTRHIELWRSDLTLLAEAGIRELRYSIPWHRIEGRQGEFNWSWMDGPMQFMQTTGLEPILDPLHHTSFPTWLTEGFLNADFPALYRRFLDHLSNRYGWVRKYTIINEPLPTTIFCSLTGMWYPHFTTERQFVAMSLQVARCMSLCSAMLRGKNKAIEIVHVDTAEQHRALDQQSVEWVDYANERRFLILDLLLGRVDQAHPLHSYLVANGASGDDLAWLRDRRANIDVLGMDYYIHSEMEWFWSKKKNRADIKPVNSQPVGFAVIAKEYIKRYPLPALLTETNIRGSVLERITWLKFMEEQCEELVRSGCDFRGFCWYPSIDSTDWSNCCTRCTKIVDPQGIWMLDPERYMRYKSELSQIYGALARGEITSTEIPARGFEPALKRRLRGYGHLMKWRETTFR